MKSKALFLFLLVFAAVTAIALVKPVINSSSKTASMHNQDYEKLWKKADSLSNNGLPKQALQIADEIAKRALNEENMPQLIKASLHQLKFRSQFEENYLMNYIGETEKNITNYPEPAKQIMHSVLADIYWQYYQQNQYIILDRTSVSDGESLDLNTWDARRFITKVTDHYDASLRNNSLLRENNLKIYDPILETKNGSKRYRPTLYDFLAHRAADFYQSSNAAITQPIKPFVINSADYFGDIQQFIQLNPEKNDTLSFVYKGLKVFQQLLAYRLQQQDTLALVDAGLGRLEFVKQHSKIAGADTLYLNALLRMESVFSGHPANADVMYKIALWYSGGSQQMIIPYNVDNTSKAENNKSKMVIAHQWCEKAIMQFPDTEGAKNCKILLKSIEAPSVGFEINEVVLPGQAFPLLIQFRNVKTAWFKIVKNDPDNEDLLNQPNLNSSEGIDKLKAQQSYKTWSVRLPEISDFMSHSVEVIVPPMDKGFYTILISDNENFEISNQNIAAQYFWASAISLISKRQGDGNGSFYILNRATGEGIGEANIQTFTYDYDYRRRDYSRKNLDVFTSGKDGFFTIPAPLNSRGQNLSFDIGTKSDRLTVSNYFSRYARGERQIQPVTRTWFFTDRSIYRPGQTLYFKGLMIYSEGDKHTPEVDKETEVALYDANGQKVASQKFSTNEFGSFSGEFVLPSGGLGGQFRLADANGTAWVNMEEYKRPRFEVKFDEINTAFKLGQQIVLNGNAVSYSGVPLDKATVNYRVVRTVSFPYPARFFYRPPFNQQEAEIANGSISTSDDGTFEIAFKAVADEKIVGTYYPVYNYRILASVTDINGETQSGESWVRVGTRALLLNVDVNEEVNRSEAKSFKLTTTNLAGKQTPASVSVRIVRMEEKSRLLRGRNWETPDLSIYSKEEWYKQLPHDPFMNDDEQLKEAETVYTGIINTAQDSLISPKNIGQWSPGTYKIKLSAKDAFGELVETAEVFKLFIPESDKLPENTYVWFHLLQEKALPGEKVNLLIGSAVQNARMLIEIENSKGIVSSKWISLKGKQQKIEIQVTEDFRGNFSVNASMILENRSYSFTETVVVPYPDRNLSIDFETFRSPMLPGSKEQWKLKIKGPDGKAAAAELLAGMYDASLDAFVPHNWYFNLYQTTFSNNPWDARRTYNTSTGMQVYNPNPENEYPIVRSYDQLNWFGYYAGNHYLSDNMGMVSRSKMAAPEAAMNDREIAEESDGLIEQTEAMAGDKETSAMVEDQPAMRRNLNETAFFFPQLVTNAEGEAELTFTMPEAITRWKFMGLAHTTDLKYGQFSKEVITRKELMVTPNLPRFFREGDTLTLQTRISNLTGNPIQGNAKLELLDAFSLESLDEKMSNVNPLVPISAEANGNAVAQWQIIVPNGLDAVMVRISAKAGNHSDGEEALLPVLTNRMLVTETLPLPVNGNETKQFAFDKLLNQANGSSTLRNHRLTLEYTSNPVWYAVQALPYIMEPKFDNSDALFYMFYANTLAAHIANSSPAIRNVFESWKSQETDALESNLAKNPELKSLLLSETPWVMEAQTESIQKHRIAQLFDQNRLNSGLQEALNKLQRRQTVNGGWPWFEGFKESRYITQQIVTGFGKLHYLKVIDLNKDPQTRQMVQQAVNYLARELNNDYNKIIKANPKPDKLQPGPMEIYYLYSLSYLNGVVSSPESARKAENYFATQARKFWPDMDLRQQAMVGLWAGRSGDAKTAGAIIRSLSDRALTNPEMGIYWRDNQGGFYWNNAPIETQAILIELFEEIAGDRQATDQMKTWLLKQKQVQAWPTNSATAEAVYALLLRGTDWLQTKPSVTIQLGNEQINPSNLPDAKAEAGTGYFKTAWTGRDIDPAMGRITVEKLSDGPAWGALYWQYFEDLDKVSAHDSPLKVSRQLFKKKDTKSGPELQPLNRNNLPGVGEPITVRIVLSTDRNMEFVHLKDLRAAGFEPLNTLSGYRWAGGLGYYETTRDASTDFFFDYLPKGTWVFEYSLVISQKGNYSAGLTTVQCMYAPEFAAHSEGIRVNIK